MQDLFEREMQVLERAQAYLKELETLQDIPVRYHEEFAYITASYAQVLRQLRWVTRISDLTTTGLNTDKTALLNKVNVDSLTEIYNRRFLSANFEYCLEALSDSGDCLTVMMLDIDRFKDYNDFYGHSAGDACLRKVATAIHNSLSGAEDFVVRYGGEEFVAVLPGADKKLGLYTAEKILSNVRNLNIPHEKCPQTGCVTISIGITCVIPKSGVGMQYYIDQADQALYQSKRTGRNKLTYLAFEEESK